MAACPSTEHLISSALEALAAMGEQPPLLEEYGAVAAFLTDGDPPSSEAMVFRARLMGALAEEVARARATHLFLPVAGKGTLVPGGLVVDANRGPAAAARRAAVLAAHLVRLQIDIAECHIRVVLKRLRDGVPRRRLLGSSASAFGRDPANEERLSGVDLLLDVSIEGAHRQPRRVLPGQQ